MTADQLVDTLDDVYRQIMSDIKDRPGTRPFALADKYNMHPATISQRIDNLRRWGLVRVVKINSRCVKLYLMEKADPGANDGH